MLTTKIFVCVSRDSHGAHNKCATEFPLSNTILYTLTVTNDNRNTPMHAKSHMVPKGWEHTCLPQLELHPDYLNHSFVSHEADVLFSHNIKSKLAGLVWLRCQVQLSCQTLESTEYTSEMLKQTSEKGRHGTAGNKE